MHLKVQVVRADEGGLPADVDTNGKYPGAHLKFPLLGEIQ